MPSPADGILDRIVKLEGETVAIGTTIALITPVGAAATPSSGPEPITSGSREAAASIPSPPEGGRSFVSPVVARIASEHSVDLSLVPGSGRGGRVTKKDLLDSHRTGGGHDGGDDASAGGRAGATAATESRATFRDARRAARA